MDSADSSPWQLATRSCKSLPLFAEYYAREIGRSGVGVFLARTDNQWGTEQHFRMPISLPGRYDVTIRSFKYSE